MIRAVAYSSWGSQSAARQHLPTYPKAAGFSPPLVFTPDLMTHTADHLVRAATQAANNGQWPEAERFWQEVRKIEPDHPKALSSLGVHALQRGDPDGAFDFLTAARALAPRDLLVLQNLAIACRERGDTAG